jgi:23S rRNA (guanosine2251-2'-O)-methyltransferase
MAHEYLYSRNAVYEALQAGRRQFYQILIADGAQEKGRIADILQIARLRSIRVDRVPKARLDKVNLAHQGVAAETDEYLYVDLLDILEVVHHRAEQPFILILDSLQDPQNFGTLLRTAEALGVHGVVIPLAHAVAVTPVVVNASSGASEYLPVARTNIAQAIDALKKDNIWIVGLDEDGEEIGDNTHRHMKGPLCLVVGSEGEGLRQLVRSKCDILLKLPMVGRIESLNAAVAGSVALYLAYFARKS